MRVPCIDGACGLFIAALCVLGCADAAELAYIAPHRKLPAECVDAETAVGATAPLASAVVSTDATGLIVAGYFSDLRSGELSAWQRDALGDDVIRTGAPPIWRASQTLEDASLTNARVILTSSSDGTGIPFRWERLDTSLQQQLDLDPAGQANDQQGSARVDYLRGSRLNEGAHAVPRFFARGSLLGAIVNSTPWLMLPPSDGYTEARAPGYPEFRLTQLARVPLVFVGAGDGMLHGFRADDGLPVMSYVPRALFSRLGALTAPQQVARPYIDGAPFVADLNIDGSRNGWRSYLFASLGRGGQGLVALDVTNGQFSEADAQRIVKWEFSDADDADLGHIVARPGVDAFNGKARQVVRLANGRWAILLGNGYNSEAEDGRSGSGAAYLFIVYFTGPSGAQGRWVEGIDYLKIATGARGRGPRNGLGTPYPLDTDRDGLVDTVYAGDRKGNVWKFDLSARDPNDWALAYPEGRPFFSVSEGSTAGRSITAPVIATSHILGGSMLHFGTGRALEENDLPTTQVQTVYGIWDRPGAAQPPSASATRLLRQVARPAESGTGVLSSDVRINDWSRVDGWLLDLPMPSESLLEPPEYVGQYLLAKTDFKARPARGCDAGWDGNVWLLRAIDGASAEFFGASKAGLSNARELGLTAQSAPLTGRFVPQGSGEVVRVRSEVLVRDVVGVTRMDLPASGGPGRRYWREIGE